MTKVKICGITNLEDARLAVELGADQLGFNFYPNSPRYILPAVARSIIEKLPANILTVGVFVNENIFTISRVAVEAKVTAIQLHGDESPDDVIAVLKGTGLEVIKALRVGPNFDPESVGDYAASAILLDSYSKTERGGTGTVFEWQIALEAQYAALGVIYLAGGLSANNVSRAIHEARPFAVDVASGVESSPGKKDAEKMKRFIDAVRKTE